jgi:hypothetical protein
MDFLSGGLMTKILGGMGAILALFLGWKAKGALSRREGRKQASEQARVQDLELEADIRRRASAARGMPDKPTGKRDRDRGAV